VTTRPASKPLTGGRPTALAIEQDDARQIAADGRSVFWTQNTELPSIMRIDASGGTPTELAQSHVSSASNIVVDETAIFWTTANHIMMLAK
jgi:hypothetical protein